MDSPTATVTIPDWLAERLQTVQHTNIRHDWTLLWPLSDYISLFFPPLQRFIINSRHFLCPKTEAEAAEYEEHVPSNLLYLPCVLDEEEADGARARSDVSPPPRRQSLSLKSPDIMVTKAADDLENDTVLLVVEVRAAQADAENARAQLCAYLEVAAKKRFASPGLRGMLVMQSVFDIFRIGEDGNAVLVMSGLPLCESGCEDFLRSIASEMEVV